MQLIDIASQGQRHHIGAQTIDDGTGLLAGAAMGLLDLDRLMALGLPMLVEGVVEFHIELARRIVGHVEQGVGGQCGAGEQRARQGGEGEATNGHGAAPEKTNLYVLAHQGGR